jgi:hypothetical protein
VGVVLAAAVAVVAQVAKGALHQLDGETSKATMLGKDTLAVPKDRPETRQLIECSTTEICTPTTLTPTTGIGVLDGHHRSHIPTLLRSL